MKKLVLILACLMAVPAFGMTLGLTDLGGGVVAVTYDATGDPNQPRAFALNITVDGDAFITDVNGFKTDGESLAASKGFGIYPGTIAIDGNGVVTAYGSPLAPAADPGAGAIDSNAIVVEFGSLYVGAPNAPAVTGTLCNIVVDCNGQSNDVNIAVTEEDTYRGGIVLEDVSVPATNLTANLAISCGSGPCFDSGHPDYAAWLSAGSPDCWCYTYQCRGDADGVVEGDVKNGYHHVGAADLFILQGSWLVKEAPDGPGIASIAGGICADFGRDLEGDVKNGYHHVGAADLFILQTNWLVKNPPDGPGLTGGCGGTLAP
ncbi:MAG: hypothetical protein K8R02_05035 [Anaerohalosphaeraceae bacterium]|nr:hypothetical protein [Anaerohalosphaeraceae bacterium]